MSTETQRLPKLVVILGPTAAGKTALALRLATEFNGEVISADSRQIYKKMTIGTAKVPGEWRWNGLRRTYFVEDIPHHLVDFLDPGKTFTVAEFRDQALKYTKLAYQSGRVPLLVGGTGLYISSVVDNFVIPRVSPNNKLRKSLAEKESSELVTLLEKLDPVTARRIDPRNKRRVIRALEVCILTGEKFSNQAKRGDKLFDILQIGVTALPDVLYKRIETRIGQMMEAGLLNEIERLIKQKYDWRLPSMNGIGYRQFRGHFEGTRPLARCVEDFKRDTRQYARRQLSWFRRDGRIVWCAEPGEAVELARQFLAN